MLISSANIRQMTFHRPEVVLVGRHVAWGDPLWSSSDVHNGKNLRFLFIMDLHCRVCDGLHLCSLETPKQQYS